MKSEKINSIKEEAIKEYNSSPTSVFSEVLTSAINKIVEVCDINEESSKFNLSEHIESETCDLGDLEDSSFFIYKDDAEDGICFAMWDGDNKGFFKIGDSENGLYCYYIDEDFEEFTNITKVTNPIAVLTALINGDFGE